MISRNSMKSTIFLHTQKRKTIYKCNFRNVCMIFFLHILILQLLPGTTPTMFSVSRMKIDIHFSLIAAAVTYIMWQSVGEDKIKKMEGKRLDDDESSKKRKGYWRVDCQSASKGGQRVAHQ